MFYCQFVIFQAVYQIWNWPHTYKNVQRTRTFIIQAFSTLSLKNFQSIKSKRESLWNMLTYTEPDILLASETWLHPGISEKEVLPDNYRFVARKDRHKDPMEAWPSSPNLTSKERKSTWTPKPNLWQHPFPLRVIRSHSLLGHSTGLPITTWITLRISVELWRVLPLCFPDHFCGSEAMQTCQTSIGSHHRSPATTIRCKSTQHLPTLYTIWDVNK